jgi:chemotaxis protein histidine kinase CheA
MVRSRFDPQPGKGSVFVISLPLTLAILPGAAGPAG